MSNFATAGDVWRPSAGSIRATRGGDAYAVRVIIEPSSAAGRVWDQLSRTLTSAGNVLFDGGASLRRVGDDVFEALSGGEDVLDSLTWCVNVTIAEAVRAVDEDAAVAIRVLAEGPAQR